MARLRSPLPRSLPSGTKRIHPSVRPSVRKANAPSRPIAPARRPLAASLTLDSVGHLETGPLSRLAHPLPPPGHAALTAGALLGAHGALASAGHVTGAVIPCERSSDPVLPCGYFFMVRKMFPREKNRFISVLLEAKLDFINRS